MKKMVLTDQGLKMIDEAPMRIKHEGQWIHNPQMSEHSHGRVHAVPEDMQERMAASLPPVVRRVPRARFESVLQMLVTEAREKFQRTGYIAWPQSIVTELKAMGWKEGNPNMWAEVELLARRYIETGENKTKATTGKFVTTPGHGH